MINDLVMFSSINSITLLIYASILYSFLIHGNLKIIKEYYVLIINLLYL